MEEDVRLVVVGDLRLVPVAGGIKESEICGCAAMPQGVPVSRRA
jgi:hypothetical protein